MSAFGLSSELNITRKEADDYINAYFAKHNDVKSFMDEQVEFCKNNGYVTTLMGRKRYIKEINAMSLRGRKGCKYESSKLGKFFSFNVPSRHTLVLFWLDQEFGLHRNHLESCFP